MFREKIRAVPLMNQMTQGVSNNDIKALAEAISKLPPPPADTPNVARMEATRTLAEQNRCNICHGGNYAGGENVPRIAGAARRLSCQNPARIQEQHAPRLRCRDGRRAALGE